MEINIENLPYLEFAHIFEAENYKNLLRPNFKKIEITYISEGSVCLKKEQHVYTAQKGDIICIILNKPIEIYSDCHHAHHTVSININWSENSSRFNLALPLIIKHCTLTDEIAKIIDNVIYNSYLYEKSPIKIANILFNILCKIDEYNSNNNDKILLPSILVEKAKKYIAKHIYKPLTQAEVAKQLNITSGYLCHIFKEHEHTTVIKYINTVKLNSLRNLVLKEGVKICDAAQLFGYSDANYVSALHKKMFGYNISSCPEIKS